MTSPRRRESDRTRDLPVPPLQNAVLNFRPPAIPQSLSILPLATPYIPHGASAFQHEPREEQSSDADSTRCIDWFPAFRSFLWPLVPGACAVPPPLISREARWRKLRIIGQSGRLAAATLSLRRRRSPSSSTVASRTRSIPLRRASRKRSSWFICSGLSWPWSCSLARS